MFGFLRWLLLLVVTNVTVLLLCWRCGLADVDLNFNQFVDAA